MSMHAWATPTSSNLVSSTKARSDCRFGLFCWVETGFGRVTDQSPSFHNPNPPVCTFIPPYWRLAPVPSRRSCRPLFTLYSACPSLPRPPDSFPPASVILRLFGRPCCPPVPKRIPRCKGLFGSNLPRAPTFRRKTLCVRFFFVLLRIVEKLLASWNTISKSWNRSGSSAGRKTAPIMSRSILHDRNTMCLTCSPILRGRDCMSDTPSPDGV